MDAHFSERIVSKIEAAKIQLDAAIRAYHQNEDIVAITLAGASEEILGKICKTRGIENAVEKIAKLEPLCQKFDNGLLAAEKRLSSPSPKSSPPAGGGRRRGERLSYTKLPSKR